MVEELAVNMYNLKKNLNEKDISSRKKGARQNRRNSKSARSFANRDCQIAGQFKQVRPQVGKKYFGRMVGFWTDPMGRALAPKLLER